MTIAQPQTRSQDPILPILQELIANMQSMNDRVNKLSKKVNQTQTVNSTKVQNTSVLTQNTTLCKVQSTISPTPLATLRRLNLRPFEAQNVGLTAIPTQTFRITLSKFLSRTRVMNKTAKLQPQGPNYSQSHRRLRIS